MRVKTYGCTACKEQKPEENYYQHSNGKRRLQCITCLQKRNAERSVNTQRERNLKHKYGITVNEYTAQLERQGGKCALCGSTDPQSQWSVFAVDHDHATGKVRGLLCHPCNKGLGQFRDNVAVMANAITYITEGGVW